MKRVMVTGGAGYVGSMLSAALVEAGYAVTVVDRFFFGVETVSWLEKTGRLILLRKDVRDLETADFEGVDAVFDLAALSNDPAGELDPQLTRAINALGRAHVARAAKAAGVKRYVLSSSCSVYGDGGTSLLTEASPTAPLTTYAACNLEAEQETLALAGDGFTPTALRLGTVFGLSRRMRYDLVVNLMTLHAVERGAIIVTGGGLQWRPLVHVQDVARAFVAALEAPTEVVSGQIFNIVHDNVQVRAIAYMVRESLPFSLRIDTAPDDPDRRNYRVSGERARAALDYVANRDIAGAVREIYDALKQGQAEASSRTSTVGWYKQIVAAQRLIEEVSLNGRLI